MIRKTVPAPIETRLAVTQFYEDYIACVDSGDLAEWHTFFTDDCLYRVTARENYDANLPHAAIYCRGVGMIKDRAAAIKGSTYYSPRHVRHFLGGLRITKLQPGEIHAHASVMVMESVSDLAPYVLFVGEYIDRIRVSGAGFLLADRACVYDNYRIFNSLVYPI